MAPSITKAKLELAKKIFKSLYEDQSSNKLAYMSTKYRAYWNKERGRNINRFIPTMIFEKQEIREQNF